MGTMPEMPMDSRRAETPLLPTLTDARADAALRESLAILRDRCPDEGLARRIGDVLDGKATLRELADSSVFEAFVTPLTERGMEQLEEAERAAGGLDNLIADNAAALERAGEAGGPSFGGTDDPGGSTEDQGREQDVRTVWSEPQSSVDELPSPGTW